MTDDAAVRADVCVALNTIQQIADSRDDWKRRAEAAERVSDRHLEVLCSEQEACLQAKRERDEARAEVERLKADMRSFAEPWREKVEELERELAAIQDLHTLERDRRKQTELERELAIVGRSRDTLSGLLRELEQRNAKLERVAKAADAYTSLFGNSSEAEIDDQTAFNELVDALSALDSLAADEKATEEFEQHIGKAPCGCTRWLTAYEKHASCPCPQHRALPNPWYAAESVHRFLRAVAKMPKPKRRVPYGDACDHCLGSGVASDEDPVRAAELEVIAAAERYAHGDTHGPGEIRALLEAVDRLREARG